MYISCLSNRVYFIGHSIRLSNISPAFPVHVQYHMVLQINNNFPEFGQGTPTSIRTVVEWLRDAFPQYIKHKINSPTENTTAEFDEIRECELTFL